MSSSPEYIRDQAPDPHQLADMALRAHQRDAVSRVHPNSHLSKSAAQHLVPTSQHRPPLSQHRPSMTQYHRPIPQCFPPMLQFHPTIPQYPPPMSQRCPDMPQPLVSDITTSLLNKLGILEQEIRRLYSDVEQLDKWFHNDERERGVKQSMPILESHKYVSKLQQCNVTAGMRGELERTVRREVSRPAHSHRVTPDIPEGLKQAACAQSSIPEDTIVVSRSPKRKVVDDHSELARKHSRHSDRMP